MKKNKTRVLKAKDWKIFFLLWLYLLENRDLSQLGATKQFPSKFRTQRKAFTNTLQSQF